jgi:hypothetical protein
MTDPKHIRPPAPTTLADRIVAIPPTVQDVDNSPARLPKNKLRADFNPELFRRQLDQHGKHVRWCKAMLCPCLNETTGQALLGCSTCDGSGYFFVDPLPIRAHMAAFDRNTKIYEKMGMWIEGATSVTVEPQYRLHYRDRIEMLDSLMPFNELLLKGNRRGIRSKLPSGVDSARYRIVNVTKLAFKPTPTSDPVTLELGFHYEVSDDGWVRWLTAGDNTISDGTRFSVLYDFHPIYQVISHPHVLRDDVRGKKQPADTAYSLPVQAACKLDFLIDINTAVTSAD